MTEKLSFLPLKAQRYTLFGGYTVYTLLIFFAINLRIFNIKVGFLERVIPFIVIIILSFSALVLFVRYASDFTDNLSRDILRLSAKHYYVVWLVLLVGMLPILLFTAKIVLQGFPNSGDEYAYVFHASTFEAGRLWNDVHPMQDFFSLYHVVEKNGKWVSGYPPGWPLILASASLLGVPHWAVNPIIGCLSIGTLALLAQYAAGNAVSVIVIISFAFSSFFIFNSSSFFNHEFTLFLTLGFVFFAIKFLNKQKWSHGIAMGIAIGFVGITRYFDTILIFIPFLLTLFLTRSKKHYLGLIWIAIGSLPFLVGLMIYNYSITENPMLPVGQWNKTHGLIGSIGFHEHNIFQALYMIMQRIFEWSEWTSPLMLLAYVLCLIYKSMRKNLEFYDIYLIIFMLGFVFYWGDGGNRYGPRYYYTTYPFVILTVVPALVSLTKENLPKIVRISSIHILLMNLIVGICYVPFWAVYNNKIVTERRDVFDLVEREGISNSIVFLESETGGIRRMSIRDLVRNGVTLTGDVIFARSRGKRNKLLKEYFPERDFWIYKRDVGNPHGQLLPMDGQ